MCVKKGKPGIHDKGSLQDGIIFPFGAEIEHSEKGQDGRFKSQRSCGLEGSEVRV